MVATARRIITRPSIIIATLIALLIAGLIGPRLYQRLTQGPPNPFPYEALRVGVDTSYAPFAVDANGDIFGLDIDLAYALGDELGLPVQIVPLGFDGLYDALITNRVDVLISAIRIDPRRSQQVRYTAPYYDDGLVLVSTTQAPIANAQALTGQRLAVEFASPGDNQVRLWREDWPDNKPAFERRPYELPQYALDAVRLNHADAALVDATSYFLYRREHPDWQAQHIYITNEPYAIAVRIDRPDTWQLVNEALRQLQADGRWHAIRNRWLG